MATYFFKTSIGSVVVVRFARPDKAVALTTSSEAQTPTHVEVSSRSK